jgi:energy-coupling factor transporter ATP-binding protein EcfA2
VEFYALHVFVPWKSRLVARKADDILNKPRLLVGREQLQAQIKSELQAGKQILLQGFGGIGKTTLAATIAADWISEGRGTVLWQKLGSEDVAFSFAAIAHPFGQQDDMLLLTEEEQILAVRNLLLDQKIRLVIFDDAWNGDTLQHLLTTVPETIPVLVTSRHRLPVEILVEVPELTSDAAVETLSYYASADFADDEIAMDLCKVLGFHPYAIEIAGKNLKAVRTSPEQLLTKIRTAPDAMKMPYQFAKSGRESIGKLLEVSFRELQPQERKVFLSFGAYFAPRATPELVATYLNTPEQLPEVDVSVLEQARSLLGDSEVTDDELVAMQHLVGLCLEEMNVDEAMVALSALVDRGLLIFVAATPEEDAFFRMHELVHSYARIQFHESHFDRSIWTCLIYTNRHVTLQNASKDIVFWQSLAWISTEQKRVTRKTPHNKPGGQVERSLASLC